MKKKVFNLLAVVLFMSSSFNVNAIVIPNKIDKTLITCFEWADSVATVNGFLQGWTFEQEYAVFVHLYEKCQNQ